MNGNYFVRYFWIVVGVVYLLVIPSVMSSQHYRIWNNHTHSIHISMEAWSSEDYGYPSFYIIDEMDDVMVAAGENSGWYELLNNEWCSACNWTDDEDWPMGPPWKAYHIGDGEYYTIYFGEGAGEWYLRVGVSNLTSIPQAWSSASLPNGGGSAVPIVTGLWIAPGEGKMVIALGAAIEDRERCRYWQSGSGGTNEFSLSAPIYTDINFGDWSTDIGVSSWHIEYPYVPPGDAVSQTNQGIAWGSTNGLATEESMKTGFGAVRSALLQVGNQVSDASRAGASLTVGGLESQGDRVVAAIGGLTNLSGGGWDEQIGFSGWPLADQ